MSNKRKKRKPSRSRGLGIGGCTAQWRACLNEDKRPPKQKGFCAHVYNPVQYLVVFIMLTAFIVGLGGSLVINASKPVSREDGQEYALTFHNWTVEDDSMVLESAQVEEAFVIDGYKDYLSHFNSLVQKCDGEKLFTVWATRVTPGDTKAYNKVLAISSDGEVYRSFEETTAYQREDLPIIAGAFGIGTAMILATSAVTYAVGSNPKRYPKWLVYCCFRRDAIRID